MCYFARLLISNVNPMVKELFSWILTTRTHNHIQGWEILCIFLLLVLVRLFWHSPLTNMNERLEAILDILIQPIDGILHHSTANLGGLPFGLIQLVALSILCPHLFNASSETRLNDDLDSPRRPPLIDNETFSPRLKLRRQSSSKYGYVGPVAKPRPRRPNY